ncbi:WD40-repeat-containing domain protein [Syncephalastrum racemosum]|uniref:WD40-repeat-containing domain protein n=1 Tax=Syncephalastrum racemosum TaxID=13706 RepID=A0A1X2HWF8_SYNRA|nr:WD40-repeat-containing domain protein [Syncephalastrum racemosum]
MLGRVQKEELVRLILQSLTDLGYNDAAQILQRDSNIGLEEENVSQFRTSVLEGDWRTAESLLPTLTLVHPDDLYQIQFLIREQKFLELLEAKKTMKALQVLRNELTPLKRDTDRLHQLSSFIVCSSVDDIKNHLNWDGASGQSRAHLLTEIQRHVSPSTMIPSARLLTLINQAYEWQRRGCLYHNGYEGNFSLFADHTCDKNQFPSMTTHVLEGHADEVWHLGFSHSGRYLATVSKDMTCIIWDMTTFDKVRILSGQPESASYLAWSPDDTKLLMCGVDAALRLWDPMTGELVHTYSEHKEQVTCCVWLPDGEHFISGACDKSMCLWHIDGVIKQRWTTQRILDMKIAARGTRVVVATYEKSIVVYDLDRYLLTEVAQIPESGTITSLYLSHDGRYALVNVQDSQELHLWDLDEQALVRKYTGQKQGSYVIRSAFGGMDEGFVLSGSEDSCVYVWSREHQSLLEVLEGHKGIVNCVSWCPTSMMFASASDDKTVRM